MDAAPLLARIAEALTKHGLEAILIGNAAAALQGAPVTTMDFDFFFRMTPASQKALELIAADFGAVRNYDRTRGLIRLTRNEDGLKLDFLSLIDGAESFEDLLGRSQEIRFGASSLTVAPLADIIKSKKAADRPRDRAVIEILEKTLEAADQQKS